MNQDLDINWVIKAQDMASAVIKKIDLATTGLQVRFLDAQNAIAGSMSSVYKAFEKSRLTIIALNQGIELVSRFLRPVIDLVKQAIQQAIEQEKAERALINVLRTRGIYTEALYQENLKIADSMKKISVFSKEEILGVQKTLLQYGLKANKLEEVTLATLNYATSQKKDLASAADIVGRSIGTTTNGLTRVGIKLNDIYDIGQRTNIVLQGLAKFSNSAATEALTYDGSMKKLSNTWNDFLGNLGKYITQSPALINSISTITGWIEKLSNITFKPMSLEDVNTEIESVQKKLEEFQKRVPKMSDLWTQEGASGVILGKRLDDLLQKRILITAESKKAEEIAKQQNSTTKLQNDIEQALLEKYQGLNVEQAEFLEQANKEKQIADNKLKLAMAHYDVWVSTLSIAEIFSNVLSQMKVNPEFAKEMGKKLQTGVGIIAGGAQSIKGAAISAAYESKNPYAMAGAAVVEIFGKTKEEFTKWINDIVNMVADLPSQIATNIPIFIDVLIKNLPRMMTALDNALPILVDGLLALLSDPTFWEAIVNVFITQLTAPANFIAIMIGIQTAVIQAIPQIIEAFLNGIVKGFGNIFTPFISIFRNLGNLFQAFGNTFRSAVDIFSGAINFFKTIVDSIKNIAGGALGGNVGGVDVGRIGMGIATMGISELFKYGGIVESVDRFERGGIVNLNAYRNMQRAQRGLVQGTSMTGDTTMIRANNREMYLDIDKQRKLWDMIAEGKGTGSKPIRIEIPVQIGKSEIARLIRELDADGYQLQAG